MAKNLVIVESPAKAKTIEGYLGKDFTVKSSYGHVRDLPPKELAIDVENNFEPKYEISADKKQIVKELKKLARDADMVWLATDEDREGEAISWHLSEALSLDAARTKRIVFHEITKSAILAAIENPRVVDQNLVNAQQARRILDRLVGFELSPVLWRKVKPSLSAGRVQSVAVRIIVEREREIQNFKSVSSFRIVAIFETNGKSVKAELPERFPTEAEAHEYVSSCIGAKFTVDSLKKTPGKKKPSAPFTTSTLQQEASRKLGYSVARTMGVAQRLYESGRITYMRTDSVNLSDTALNQAQSVIKDMYGTEFGERRKYTSKTKGAQEAHEAIRPTDLSIPNMGEPTDEGRLYELIWKRTVASQMAEARLEKTTINIASNQSDKLLVAKGEVITFEGFLKVYMESTDEEPEEQQGVLPAVNEGQSLDLRELTASQRFTHHPARYTEASLVKKLEELGIGRPSTYAPTISTIQKRGYVEKTSREGTKRIYRVLTLADHKVVAEDASETTGAEKNKMFPTDIGIVVNDFLVEHFGNILDFNFTASVEQEFDDIAEGLKTWGEMIKKFYDPFHESIEATIANSRKATGERELGKDPKTDKPVFAKIGRFGPMIQIGLGDDDDKKFASLRGEQSINSITLDEALELFKLPRKLGEFDGEELVAGIGRFGPYIRHGKIFASLDTEAGDDPLKVTKERAVELVVEKREAARLALIKEFDEDPEIRILKGRYGPYIKHGKKNVRIPKDAVPEELTFEQVKEIIEKFVASGGGRKKRK